MLLSQAKDSILHPEAVLLKLSSPHKQDKLHQQADAASAEAREEVSVSCLPTPATA